MAQHVHKELHGVSTDESAEFSIGQDEILEKESDTSNPLTSAQVNHHQSEIQALEDQGACSAQKLSLEQEQLFQKAFKNPCFTQWLNTRV